MQFDVCLWFPNWICPTIHRLKLSYFSHPKDINWIEFELWTLCGNIFLWLTLAGYVNAINLAIDVPPKRWFKQMPRWVTVRQSGNQAMRCWQVTCARRLLDMNKLLNKYHKFTRRTYTYIEQYIFSCWWPLPGAQNYAAIACEPANIVWAVCLAALVRQFYNYNIYTIYIYRHNQQLLTSHPCSSIHFYFTILELCLRTAAVCEEQLFSPFVYISISMQPDVVYWAQYKVLNANIFTYNELDLISFIKFACLIAFEPVKRSN